MQRTMKYSRRRMSAHGVSGLRSGMTIMEVMFAIMITTIGLLGAVSVFPVASEMARKGRLNDEVAICADTAVHKMDARGMRRPDHWLIPRIISGTPTMVPGSLNGAIIPGESYCLDPRFVSVNLDNNGLPTQVEATGFPAFPFAAGTGPNDPNNGPGEPRMQRITLVNGFPSTNPPFAPAFFPMLRFQADSVFSFDDQMTYERPGVQKGSIARNDNALPAFQLYSPIVTNGGILPGKREDDGKLSWMATLVPKFDHSLGSVDDTYVLSIVVFYGRSPNLRLDLSGNSGPLNEWSASIFGSDFHSTGYGGGEVTISAPAANGPAQLAMRAGDWVMLSGHSSNPSNLNLPSVPVFKWYRVTEADEAPRGPVTVNGNSYYQRDVTLVGPDWDLQDALPFNMGVAQGDGIPDDVTVTIVPNVVAVFDRSVRLERDGTGY